MRNSVINLNNTTFGTDPMFSGLNIYCYYSPICPFEDIKVKSVLVMFIMQCVVMNLYM